MAHNHRPLPSPKVKLTKLAMDHVLAPALLADETEAVLAAQEIRLRAVSDQMIRHAERFLAKEASA